MSRLLAMSLIGGAVFMLALPGCGGEDGASQAVVRITRGDHLPNIILLTVDTLRADHIARYGYERDTMPSVERFAETAVVFDNAVVPRGETRPSYASMLTGLYPYRHGVRHNHYELNKSLTTLPEILKSAGYHTAGFVSNFVMIKGLSGLAQGFDVYDDRTDELMTGPSTKEYQYQRTAGNTLKAILAWLATGPRQPFFLFINFIDPHGPYLPPDRFRTLYHTDKTRPLQRSQMPDYQFIEGHHNYYEYVDRYDGEIRYTDEATGILIEELKARDLWDDSFVVFTADHGECLGEQNIFFAHNVHVLEATVRVPMMIRLPDSSTNRQAFRPRRTASMSSPMDLPPTILAYLKLTADVDFDGRDLLPDLAGAERTKRTILLECLDSQYGYGARADLYAIRTATHKLVRCIDKDPRKKGEAKQSVYHIADDPLEERSLQFNPEGSTHRALSDGLDKMLARVKGYELPFKVVKYVMPFEKRPGFVRERWKTADVEIKTLTTRQAKRLRSLGYVH